jgi:hypothetical protein
MKTIVKTVGQVTTLSLIAEGTSDLAGFNHLIGNEKAAKVKITTDTDTVELKPAGKANNGPKKLTNVCKLELVITSPKPTPAEEKAEN